MARKRIKTQDWGWTEIKHVVPLGSQMGLSGDQEQLAEIVNKLMNDSAMNGARIEQLVEAIRLAWTIGKTSG